MNVVIIGSEDVNPVAAEITSKLKNILSDDTGIHFNNYNLHYPDAVVLLLHDRWDEEGWLSAGQDMPHVDYLARASDKNLMIVPVRLDDAAAIDAGMMDDGLAPLANRVDTQISSQDGSAIEALSLQLKEILPAQIAQTKPVTTTSSVYEPIILPEIDYVKAGGIAAIVGAIGLATFAAIVPVEYNSTLRAYFWQDANSWGQTVKVTTGLVGVALGFVAARLWQPYLPDASWTKYIVPVVWGLSFFMALGHITQAPVLIAAGLTLIGSGTLLAYWLPSPPAWFQLNPRMVLTVLTLVTVLCLSYVVAIMLFGTVLSPFQTINPQTALDSRLQIMTTYAFLGAIGNAGTTIFFLRTLRDVALRYHPAHITVIEEGTATTS